MEAEAKLFFQQLLLDSDSTSSDEEFIGRGPIIIKPKIQKYIEEVVDRYTDHEFRQNFRMNRYTFNHILQLVEADIASDILDTGRHTIAAKDQLLIAIWYFATPDSFRSICSRFDIGKATGLRTVRRVAKALCKLAPTIIHWPSDDDVRFVQNGFNEMGFPNTIGAIDGTYVPIPLPREFGLSYITRKKFPAIILQAECDHTLKFTHCYAGEAGSSHDARVLKKSEIWSYIETRAPQMFPDDTHIIRDKAYPCIPQLITPYKNNAHLTQAQIHFNVRLASARNTIERAFGLLKNRFRRLKYLDIRCLKWAPHYIIACCVLHNICIMQNDALQIDAIELPQDDIENEGEIGNREIVLSGNIKRNRICLQLINER